MSGPGLHRRALLGAGLWLAATAAAAAHGPGASPAAGSPGPADPLAGRFGGPFTLTAHDGTRVGDASFRGRFMLIYFGYSHCEDVCPLDLAVMEQALDLLGPAADAIQPLFVTVDPARDTPAVLAGFVADFHPRLIGLTGSQEEIAAVAKAFKVHRRRLEPAVGAKDAYIVDHGSLTFLMGRDGRFLTLAPHRTQAEAMAATLRRYVVAA